MEKQDETHIKFFHQINIIYTQAKQYGQFYIFEHNSHTNAPCASMTCIQLPPSNLPPSPVLQPPLIHIASNSFCQQYHQSSHPLVTKGAGLPTTALLNVVIAVSVIAIHQSGLSIQLLMVLLAPIPHV